jgi:LacI family transcriptional regulator
VAGAYAVPSFWPVVNDDAATGRAAGDYLLSCGFNNFAYCGVAGTGWSEQRERGFCAAVAAADLSPSVFAQSLPWWEKVASRGRLARWLLGLPLPAGLFACNDTAGLKVAGLCRDLGIAVPESLAIIGVDNEDVLCEMASPTLTSIQLDCEEIGFRAAALLDGLLAAPPRPAPTPSAPRSGSAPPRRPILVAPGGVVERESTRVYTSDDPLVRQAMRFIRLNADRPIDVGDVLAAVPASRRSLESRFKRATGRTLKEEVVRVRLSRARELLRGTRLTVADVAARSGFASVQRFHEVFRAAEGATPGAYRAGTHARP